MRIIQTKDPNILEVKSLRPTRYGNQVATVKINAKECYNLIETSKLRIGLNICDIEERINLNVLSVGNRTTLQKAAQALTEVNYVVNVEKRHMNRRIVIKNPLVHYVWKKATKPEMDSAKPFEKP